MSERIRRVLLIDDRGERRELLAVVLGASPELDVQAPSDAVAVGAALRDPAPDVVVLAHPCSWLPEFELAGRVVSAFPSVPTLLLTEPADAAAHAAARTIEGAITAPADPGAALRVRDAVLAVRAPAQEEVEYSTNPGRPAPKPRLPPKDEAPTALMPAIKRPVQEPKVVALEPARRHRDSKPPTPEAAGLATVRDAAALGRLEDVVAELEAGRTVHLVADDAEADCEGILGEVRRTLGDLLEESGGEISRGPLPVLPVSANQIAQVFQILVSNALTYRAAEPPRVHVRAERDGRFWQIAVEDNGRGVPSGDRDRIFERFERGEGAAGTPGSGIGLSVCKRIVEGFGGRIWVRPGTDEGSIFIFTVPVADAAARA